MSPPAKRRRTDVNATTAASAKPNLATLPYHILLTILTHAGEGNVLHDWPNSHYLVGAATVCRSFLDPALAALYYNPPTHPPKRAQQLLETLQKFPELGAKIKKLAIEVNPLLEKKIAGYGYFNLLEFVRLATGLREIHLAHPVDRPPYDKRKVEISRNWKYSMELFDAIEGLPAAGGDAAETSVARPPPTAHRLRAWHWDGYMMDFMPQELNRIHLLNSFQTIRSLSFINIDLLTDETEPALVQLLSSLPELESLEFECCPAANDITLSALPIEAPDLKLKELRFITCDTLEADVLRTFLSTSVCVDLKQLVVKHCRGCSLAFLPVLPSKLEEFEFDGRLFSALVTNFEGHYDARPMYQSILDETDIPSWPRALQSIRMDSLRKWSGGDACRAFLQSLLDSKDQLPYLRELRIHCNLNEGWRERAAFRDYWIPRLRSAFVRKGAVPQEAPVVVEEEEKISPKWRSARTRTTIAEKQKAGKSEGVDALVYSGMCDPNKIEIVVDNQRPTDHAFVEDDFQDEGSVFGTSRTSTSKRRRGKSSR